MMLLLLSLIVPLSFCHDGYVSPVQGSGGELEAGPIIRSGRYRIIADRIVTSSDEGFENTYPEREFQDQEQHPRIPDGAARYLYTGDLTGRRVRIFTKQETPIIINDKKITRLGPPKIIDRWAEGGYQNPTGVNVPVYYGVGADFYADQAVPFKSA